MTRAVGFVTPDIPDGVFKGSQRWLAPKRLSCAWEEVAPRARMWFVPRSLNIYILF